MAFSRRELPPAERWISPRSPRPIGSGKSPLGGRARDHLGRPGVGGATDIRIALGTEVRRSREESICAPGRWPVECGRIWPWKAGLEPPLAGEPSRPLRRDEGAASGVRGRPRSDRGRLRLPLRWGERADRRSARIAVLSGISSPARKTLRSRVPCVSQERPPWATPARTRRSRWRGDRTSRPKERPWAPSRSPETGFPSSSARTAR